MSFLSDMSGRVGGVFRPGLDLVKSRLLGPNNERLDFVMDSFYKLSPKQQTGVLAGLGALLTSLVVVIFAVYFSRIHTLEEELNSGYEALREIRQLGAELKLENKRMKWLERSIENKTQSFRPKPFFEKTANKVGVTLKSLRSQEGEIPQDNPLSLTFKEVQVEFQMPKVSIPRMLEFMSEVEKSRKTLTVKNLKIRARYGDRLYFDTEAEVVGFKKL